MKWILRILLVFVFIAFIGGGIMSALDISTYKVVIGSGVLVLAFVLMPLFIYHSYKGKDLTKYSMKHNDPTIFKDIE